MFSLWFVLHNGLCRIKECCIRDCLNVRLEVGQVVSALLGWTSGGIDGLLEGGSLAKSGRALRNCTISQFLRVHLPTRLVKPGLNLEAKPM